jgi:hypothetical protein
MSKEHTLQRRSEQSRIYISIGHGRETVLEQETKLYQNNSWLRYRSGDTAILMRPVSWGSGVWVSAAGNG